jgi:hypothetical protein
MSTVAQKWLLLIIWAIIICAAFLVFYFRFII